MALLNSLKIPLVNQSGDESGSLENLQVDDDSEDDSDDDDEDDSDDDDDEEEEDNDGNLDEDGQDPNSTDQDSSPDVAGARAGAGVDQAHKNCHNTKLMHLLKGKPSKVPPGASKT